MSESLRCRFESWLIEQGYKQYTPSGNLSTVYDYQKRINKVIENEKLASWEQLGNNIKKYVGMYDVNGEKASEGQASHRAVINALRAYQKFIKAIGWFDIQ